MKEFKPTTLPLGSDRETTKQQKEEKQTFLEDLAKDGFDVNNKENVATLGQMVVVKLNELFSQKYGINVPEDKLPIVFIKEESAPSHVVYNDKEGKKMKTTTIQLPGIDSVLNGNNLAEEIAHFYRFYFEPDEPDEIITDEFFGFLGRKLWEKMLPDISNTEFSVLVDDNGKAEVPSKKEVLHASSLIRQIIKLEKQLVREESDEIKKFKEQRKNAIIYQRGYGYADKVDLEKIHDWQKLFSMPNSEVRKRFFTSNLDYSGL